MQTQNQTQNQGLDLKVIIQQNMINISKMIKFYLVIKNKD
jgi:hypothetical protein